MLVHKYERFKMETNKIVFEIFTIFIDIVNDLKSLGKIFTNVKIVKKIKYTKKLGTKVDCH